METRKPICPVCEGDEDVGLDRRDFLRTVGTSAAAAASVGLPLFAVAKAQAAPTPNSAAETAVKALYDSLTDFQKKEICFDWNYKERRRGLLRTHVSNNWQITKHHIKSDFYNKQQQI